MIAHAITAGHFFIPFCPLQCGFYIFYGRLMKPGSVFRRKADGIHLASVGSFPDKNRGVQPGPHEHIGIHTAFLQDLGKDVVVSEAVHIGAYGTQPSEAAFQVTLRIQPLSYKGFPAGQNTVRFQKPSPCNFPSAFRYTLFDFLKHLRKYPFYPFKKQGGGGSEFKILKFLHSLQRGGISGLNLLHPLFPVPEPYRIDMGISYHIKLFLFHSSAFLLISL